MSTKAVAILLLAVAAGLLGWWLAAGAHIFTMTSRLVQVKDEVFGTTVGHWEKAYTPGLEIFGPVVVVLFAIGAWLLIKDKRARRSA
jgi:hypothetical protein